MKHAIAWLRALALSTALTSLAFQVQGNEMEIENNKVLNAVSAMTQAFQDGDIDAVMTAYEPGATVHFEPGVPVSDRRVLEEMFRGMAAISPEFTYSEHEVVVSGDMAVHIAPWTMTGTQPDGQAVTQSGLSVAVLRKQEDGAWLIVIDNPHGHRLLSE